MLNGMGGGCRIWFGSCMGKLWVNGWKPLAKGMASIGNVEEPRERMPENQLGPGGAG